MGEDGVKIAKVWAKAIAHTPRKRRNIPSASRSTGFFTIRANRLQGCHGNIAGSTVWRLVKTDDSPKICSCGFVVRSSTRLMSSRACAALHRQYFLPDLLRKRARRSPPCTTSETMLPTTAAKGPSAYAPVGDSASSSTRLELCLDRYYLESMSTSSKEDGRGGIPETHFCCRNGRGVQILSVYRKP